jgi:outer membrane protein assembly factor BamB
MYGRYNSSFGACASPRIHEDAVYVSCVTAGTSYVAAFELDSGSVKWKRDRVTNATGDARDSFSSPAFIKLGQSLGLLVSGADWINAYDLNSGEELWRAGGLRIGGRYRHSSASPAAYNDFIIAASGNPSGGEGRVMAFQAGGRGDITGTQVWTVSRSTPDSTSPVAYGDHVFIVSDKGIASCVDLATGQVAWRYRLGGGKYYSSPVAGDGTVYFLSNEGRCTVFAAQAKGKTLAINELPGRFFATPAIGVGRIYLRSNDRLYAIGSESTPESLGKKLPKPEI